jgi:hypothetical protein
MAEKKEKGTINLKKNGTKSEETKLTKADFDLALETIDNQRKEIEYWKEATASARNGEEHYLNLLDQEYKKNDEIFQFVKNNIQRLKYAFKMGFDVTGSVTYADIDYNLDLLPRMLEHKFFKEEKEQ